MKLLFQITPGVLAIALAASLAACGSDNDSQPTLDSTVAPQGQVVAGDCRSPNAQSTQRGCKPVTRMMGSL